MTATVTPLPLTGSALVRNALTGLTGYMTLSFGAKVKPASGAAKISDTEVLIAKDGRRLSLDVLILLSRFLGKTFFVGLDGKLSRLVPM